MFPQFLWTKQQKGFPISLLRGMSSIGSDFVFLLEVIHAVVSPFLSLNALFLHSNAELHLQLACSKIFIFSMLHSTRLCFH